MFLNPRAAGRAAAELAPPREEARETAALGRGVGLQPNDPAAPIETLSGGNQQKVVMARWFRIGGAVLALEDPTAGVDVGAKAEIYRLLAEAVSRGLAVLSISTDFEEVAAICHRALVFRRGSIVAQLEGRDLTVRAARPGRLPARRPTAAASEPADEARAMQSIKSNALEPTRLELARLPLGQRLVRLMPVYGLPILTVLLIVFFSLLLPRTFPTMLNLRSILGDKSGVALLSLAAMIPMMAGRIDLTVGYGIVLWHVMAIALQTQLGLDWPVAVIVGAGAWAACWARSTASWSRWRRSIPSSPRSAPAR